VKKNLNEGNNTLKKERRLETFKSLKPFLMGNSKKKNSPKIKAKC
jgi:hypothetical protein